jgi:AcrR family transcriptional regulator
MEEKLPLEKRIVETALKMFNESGIEYVGMRELAAILDIRVGNLTYYFPTKDDLVNRLSIELTDENNKAIIAIKDMTMDAFLDMLKQVFQNQAKYRCIMLSFVHIIDRNPLIAKRYKKTQSERNKTWAKNIQALTAGKYISANSIETDFLVSSISLIARFWISEAAISFKNLNGDQQLQHYLKIIARVFLPYATTKGKLAIHRILGP